MEGRGERAGLSSKESKGPNGQEVKKWSLSLLPKSTFWVKPYLLRIYVRGCVPLCLRFVVLCSSWFSL